MPKKRRPKPTLMEYRSVIDDAIHGRMLNRTESAKYLGISRKQFDRIGLAPDLIQDTIYPFWAVRILNLMPNGIADEKFDRAETRRKGIACGNYLIGGMDAEQVETLRESMRDVAADVLSAGKCASNELTKVLIEYGIEIRFSIGREAEVFRDAILSAINKTQPAAV